MTACQQISVAVLQNNFIYKKTGVRLQFVTPAFEDIQMSKTQYPYMMDKTPTEKMVPKPGLPFPPQAVELPCPPRIN